MEEDGDYDDDDDDDDDDVITKRSRAPKFGSDGTKDLRTSARSDNSIAVIIIIIIIIINTLLHGHEQLQVS